jgi:hypothetical protein
MLQIFFLTPFFSGQFAEGNGEVRFPEIPAIILERVIQYLYYKVGLTNYAICHPPPLFSFP